MPNQQLKQKAIQEAYGEYYPSLQANINNDGYCMMYDDKSVKLTPNFNELGFTKDYTENNIDSGVFPDGSLQWRPKSLGAIDNNNGWTRIEPDESNLPATEAMYKVIDDSGYVRDFQWYDNEPVHELWKEYGITHYRPVTELPKPIY